jgi:hypothetical protein
LFILQKIFFDESRRLRKNENGSPLSSHQLSPCDKYIGTNFTQSVALKVPSQISHPSVSLESISPNLFMELVAGTSSYGYSGDNGPATSAKIGAYIPWVDTHGNIYIPDDSFRIRKVDTAGIITTFGGTGQYSFAGTSGNIGSVSFMEPYAIVSDVGGTTLFISDKWYIWKYLFSTDIVTVFAGTAGSGQGFSGDNGPATLSQLENPCGLWLTTSGDLYIADTDNNRIRRVSSNIITTIAGSGTFHARGSFSGDNGPSTSATLNYPRSTYMDTNGKLYIADTENNRIRLVDTNHIITTYAGTGFETPFNGNNIPALSANIYRAYDVKGDTAGNIYIADQFNHVMYMVAPNAIISVLFGSGSAGFASGISSRTSNLNYPLGFWLSDNSVMYFSDLYTIHRSIIVASPTSQPTAQPAEQPSFQPSCQPTSQPTSFISGTLREGLVAYYPFDGNARDATGNGNNGEVHSASLTGDRFSRSNRAYSFDGSSSYIIINNGLSFDFSNSFSVSCWINPSASQLSAGPSIINKSHGFNGDSSWLIYRHGSSATSFSFEYFQLTTSRWCLSLGATDLVANQWNHYAITKENTKLSSYLNGNLISTAFGADSAIKTNGNAPLLIGVGYNQVQYFKGLLDDILIYNRTLTAQEVLSLYQFDAPTSQPSEQPSSQPTSRPSRQPSGQPSQQPISRPSSQPTLHPSAQPSVEPSQKPTTQPTMQPSIQPFSQPTCQPTAQPTQLPTKQPLCFPTSKPSVQPTNQPTSQPSDRPSSQPSNIPTKVPSSQPVSMPSSQPSIQPTSQPLSFPSSQPSRQPSASPTRQPTHQPTTTPSFQPISEPTSIPTSLPSCEIGDYDQNEGIGSNCLACPVGTFGVLGAVGGCTKCSIGTYQNSRGQRLCKECPYPRTNVEEGSSDCSSIYYELKNSIFYVAAATGALWIFVLILLRNEPFMGAIVLNLLLPSFDAFTNIAYLLSTKYYNVALFLLLVFALSHSIITFSLKLFLLRPIPGWRNHIPTWSRLWWLGYRTGTDVIPYPTSNGKRITIFIENEIHDSLYKLLWEAFVWILCIFGQTLYTILTFSSDCFLYVIFLIFWFSVGVVFELSNTLAIGRVWDLWFRLWTESEDFTELEITVDTSMMNYGFLNRLLLETFPSAIIQIINNVALKKPWTPIAILSFIASLFTFANLIYRYVFYHFCMKETVGMKDIPMDNTLKIQIPILGIDRTLIDGKLPVGTVHHRIMNRPKVVDLLGWEQMEFGSFWLFRRNEIVPVNESDEMDIETNKVLNGLEQSYKVFISLRFKEAANEANILKSALEAKGISTFLCAVHPGGDIAREIVYALHNCQLAIIMGTKTYGKDTGIGFSTFEELRYIHKKKPFFLIKMCEIFKEPETAFRLDDSVSYVQWFPGRPLPDGLVTQILKRLASVTAEIPPSEVLPFSIDP